MLESTAFAEAVDTPHTRASSCTRRAASPTTRPGLYPQPTVDAYAARWPDLDVRPVPDVNHYTIVLSRRGAAAVADAVRAVDARG